MEEKVVAESLFKGKKENYPGSVKEMFADTLLGRQDRVLLHCTFLSIQFSLNTNVHCFCSFARP